MHCSAPEDLTSLLAQVVHYAGGQHYSYHHDAEDGKPGEPTPKMRVLTLFYYFNDVEDGGETHFPHAGGGAYDASKFEDAHGRAKTLPCELSEGLAVKPKKGDAIMWYNVLPAIGGRRGGGEQWGGGTSQDPRSRHAGCAVTAGEKWGANVSAPSLSQLLFRGLSGACAALVLRRLAGADAWAPGEARVGGPHEKDVFVAAGKRWRRQRGARRQASEAQEEKPGQGLEKPGQVTRCRPSRPR